MTTESFQSKSLASDVEFAIGGNVYKAIKKLQRENGNLLSAIAIFTDIYNAAFPHFSSNL